jgi:hypothetical protein
MESIGRITDGLRRLMARSYDSFLCALLGGLIVEIRAFAVEYWKVDTEWSVWDDDGFSRWRHNYRQRISVDAGIEGNVGTV